ncbi:MAG: peptidoglycan-binding protein [Ruminococcus sp.]|nr:peptidoglycan-binding protein [Ruminococcus sp.]
MHRIKKLTAIILSILTLSSVCVFGATTSASASGTGAGLAEYALNAYYSGWSYVYGGATPGAVDCSGLIYSYCGGERCGDPQLNTATETGSVSAGVPRVHGLGLWRPGHVGVYVGDGMEVDARGDEYGVCYESIYSSYLGWTYWFKLAAVSYVTNGWEKFNGDYYYYENGQYIVDTSRVIDGTTYYFDSKGRSSQTPSNMSSTTSGSSSSSFSSSKPTSWRNGSSGDEVKKIQNRLAELGFYTGAIDGYFGDGTEQAYRAFQKAAGLTVDGIAGSDREVLYSDDAPYAKNEETTKADEKEDDAEAETEASETTEGIKAGDSGEKVASIQSRLKELGYYDGEENGNFDSATTSAVKAFQSANGLEVTGVVDDETHYMLFYYEYAVAYEETVEETEATEATEEATLATVNPGNMESGPVQLPEASSVSGYIIANEQNQLYANKASEVVEMTNSVTKRALSKSADVIPSATTAEVKRTASIWLWFVLVAVILGALSLMFFIRDRKTNTRYARYTAKKKKRLEKSSISSARW